MAESPYAGLSPEAFWKTGVADKHPTEMANLYRKRFPIRPRDRVTTAGSCFAQNISRYLISAGYTVSNKEPAPPGLSKRTAEEHGYGIYSARYGNIYTTRQLLQLTREALGDFEPRNAVWEKDGRFYDALRPGVEPGGLGSVAEVQAHRRQHLGKVKELLSGTDVFIFTLGLTETWEDIASGTVYPTAPGTIAGSYDPAAIRFKNLSFAEVLGDFLAFRDIARNLKPDMRFLLTVSPVPLTGTASGQHVLAATTYSKSVLRAVVGELYAQCEDIDYFPSYEIITGPASRGFFYAANLRSITDQGVETVMRTFFAQHPNHEQARAAHAATIPLRRAANGPVKPARRLASTQNVQCEESFLEAFAN